MIKIDGEVSMNLLVVCLHRMSQDSLVKFDLTHLCAKHIVLIGKTTFQALTKHFV